MEAVNSFTQSWGPARARGIAWRPLPLQERISTRSTLCANDFSATAADTDLRLPDPIADTPSIKYGKRSFREIDEQTMAQSRHSERGSHNLNHSESPPPKSLASPTSGASRKRSADDTESTEADPAGRPKRAKTFVEEEERVERPRGSNEERTSAEEERDFDMGENDEEQPPGIENEQTEAIPLTVEQHLLKWLEDDVPKDAYFSDEDSNEQEPHNETRSEDEDMLSDEDDERDVERMPRRRLDRRQPMDLSWKGMDANGAMLVNIPPGATQFTITWIGMAEDAQVLCIFGW